MSVKNSVALLFLAFLVLAPGAVLAGGNANFTIGERAFGGDWEPQDDQIMLGVVVDWGPDDWPVHLVLGLNGSSDSREESPYYASGETVGYGEISFGAVWLPMRTGSSRPYLGAGIIGAMAMMERDVYGLSGDEDTDLDLGYYANAGVYWRLGSRFNLGFDLRYGGGTEFELHEPGGLDIERNSLDGGYLAISLLLGFGWGG